MEGGKLYETGLHWGISSEVMYRVDVFRRTVHRNNSAPLIQFYGPRAVRKWAVGEPVPKEWEQVDETAALRTVDLDPKLLRFKPVKEKPTGKKRSR